MIFKTQLLITLYYSNMELSSLGGSSSARHSSSPLCPPPPNMPNIIPCTSSSLKSKRLHRSERMRDSSSASSASSSAEQQKEHSSCKEPTKKDQQHGDMPLDKKDSDLTKDKAKETKLFTSPVAEKSSQELHNRMERTSEVFKAYRFY